MKYEIWYHIKGESIHWVSRNGEHNIEHSDQDMILHYINLEDTKIVNRELKLKRILNG